MAFELADGIDCCDFLNRLKLVISSSHLGDNRTLAIPIAQTIYWEMGAERRREMGSPSRSSGSRSGSRTWTT
jgi:O-acetylhomoserine (thiol)-lyase